MSPAANKLRGTVQSLTAIIAAEITDTGPMPLERYMSLCLSHPQLGVYSAHDPIGADGDFITAPEVSQMFGELIGLWCVALWHTMGSPEHFNLIELGPGRGTLMADILRATGQVLDFSAAVEVHLVETSPLLAKKQRYALQHTARQRHWHTDLDTVPSGPTIVIANEFFDALPIKQIEFVADIWRERLVELAPDGGFHLTHDTSTQTDLPYAARKLKAENGDIAETCLAAHDIMQAICARFDHHPGAALIVDYGYQGPAFGDTLQALRKHQFTDPFARPGSADLTAHVDFSALAKTAHSSQTDTCGPIDQGAFLQQLGIVERARALARSAPAAQARDIATALHRLCDISEMGSLFKVMAVTSRGLATPPPFVASVSS